MVESPGGVTHVPWKEAQAEADHWLPQPDTGLGADKTSASHGAARSRRDPGSLRNGG